MDERLAFEFCDVWFIFFRLKNVINGLPVYIKYWNAHHPIEKYVEFNKVFSSQKIKQNHVLFPVTRTILLFRSARVIHLFLRLNFRRSSFLISDQTNKTLHLAIRYSVINNNSARGKVFELKCTPGTVRGYRKHANDLLQYDRGYYYTYRTAGKITHVDRQLSCFLVFREHTWNAWSI